MLTRPFGTGARLASIQKEAFAGVPRESSFFAFSLLSTRAATRSFPQRFPMKNPILNSIRFPKKTMTKAQPRGKIAAAPTYKTAWGIAHTTGFRQKRTSIKIAAV